MGLRVDRCLSVIFSRGACPLEGGPRPGRAPGKVHFGGLDGWAALYTAKDLLCVHWLFSGRILACLPRGGRPGLVSRPMQMALLSVLLRLRPRPKQYKRSSMREVAGSMPAFSSGLGCVRHPFHHGSRQLLKQHLVLFRGVLRPWHRLLSGHGE